MICVDLVLYCIVLYCIVLYCIVLYCIVLYCIVLYLRLYSSTGASNPSPESSNFLCPLLSLSVPLPVAPQYHLFNDALVFRLILRTFLPLDRAMVPVHFHFALVTMSVPLGFFFLSFLPNDGVTGAVF